MASRYWVGGTASWDATAGSKWALTSGAAGGQAIPTIADAVFFDAASGAVTCTIATGNTNALSITCTGFTGTLTGTAAISTRGNFILVTGMTYTYTGLLTITDTGTLTSAGKTFGSVTVNAAARVVTLSAALTTSAASTFTLTAGTLILTSGSISTGTFSSSNTNVRAITVNAGTSVSINAASGSLLMSTITGLTLSGTFTVNVTVGGGSPSINYGITGGTVGTALNFVLNASPSASPGLLIGSGSYIGTLALGVVGPNAVSGTYFACGSLTLSVSGIFTNLNPTFLASGTLTCNGATLGSTTINGSGITVTLGSALIGSTLTVTQGTFTTSASNYAVTLSSFNSSNTNVRTITLNGSTVTLSGVNGFSMTTSTNATLNAGTSTISMTSASAKTFGGGGLTYYNLNQGGAGALTITGSNTFNNIANTTQPASVLFTAGTTSTFTSFSLSGTSGNLITIGSVTAASHTLSKASGTVSVSFCSISRSSATGGATWRAFLSNGNVNGGNNTGWNFGATGNFLVFF